ncbi:MAG: DUF4340 domain-containing protein [Magnetococcales bacterium]|nr:DUF4340 domain-containing protein [Magnetococcales bacterium]
MEKTIRNLTALLVGQIFLAGVLLFSGNNLEAIIPEHPLLALGKEKIDKIVIEADVNSKLILKQKDNRWILPDHYNFPADTKKVESLLDRLKSVKRGLPVTKSKGALSRFKVSDDSFERRISLAAKEQNLATLYLGTSPSMRQIHARNSDDKEVFSIKFAAHQAPVNKKDWEDKSVLQIPEADIEKIIVAGFAISQQTTKGETPTKQWLAESLNKGELLQDDNVETLVRELANLRIDHVLGIKDEERYGLNKPQLQLSLTQKGEGSVEYKINKIQDESIYVLKASTRPEYFALPEYAGKKLVENSNREKLIKTQDDQEGSTSD